MTPTRSLPDSPVPEARLAATEHGLAAETDGWFVVNTAECAWIKNEKFGRACDYEGKTRFPQLGVNLHVLDPGQPNCHYHRETAQEDFLVLSGECLLIVEGQERKLKAWDFVHCAPGVAHVFVGAGDGPCAILMIGTRTPDEAIEYPVEPLALARGAGVTKATPDPNESYKDTPRWEPSHPEWPLPGRA